MTTLFACIRFRPFQCARAAPEFIWNHPTDPAPGQDHGMIYWFADQARIDAIAARLAAADPETRMIRSLGKIAEVRIDSARCRSIPTATANLIHDPHEFEQWADLVMKIFWVRPEATLPSTAVHAWRHTLSDTVDVDPDSAEDARLALYGGYAFTRDTRAQGRAQTWDRNGAYAAVMRDFRYPAGSARRIKSEKRGRPAIYKVSWSAPELPLPLLPWRAEDGSTAWLLGSGESWITAPELDFARKRGYEIKVLHGWEWERWERPFTRFVRRIEQARGIPELAETAKLLPPMLYGRFAVAPIGTEIFVPTSRNDLNGASPVDGGHELWARPVDQPNRPRNPAWAAYIAAYQRIALLGEAYRVGVGRLIAGHTDSLTIKDGAFPFRESDRIGDWRLDRRWKKFRSLGPTTSVGLTREREGDAWIRKGNPGKKTAQTLYSIRLDGVTPERWPGVSNQPRRGKSLSWKLGSDGIVSPRRLTNGAIEA